MRRLDRILVNDDGIVTWPSMRVSVLPWDIFLSLPYLILS